MRMQTMKNWSINKYHGVDVLYLDGKEIGSVAFSCIGAGYLANITGARQLVFQTREQARAHVEKAA